MHGQQKADLRDATMTAFAAGEMDLLVATTVIEVGIDVPNASVIVIEDAERFGLAQLHQLRGRVGRGTQRSFCILLSDATDDLALRRLEVVRGSNDGFAIAEADLALRGAGNLLGTRQSGLPPLRVASLFDPRHIELAQRARGLADSIVGGGSVAGTPAAPGAAPERLRTRHRRRRRGLMRVIAGVAGGQPLVAPRDRGTRPITDRVKETLFAILGERVPDARVLDLYAGSGAIGIEALSRGAAHATFVEQARQALTALRTNLERTRLADLATVEPTDVERFLAAAGDGPWDLAFLDPPYEVRAIVAPLRALEPHLAPDAMVVVKHFWRTEIPEVAGLEPVRQRRFGETMLSFLEAAGR